MSNEREYEREYYPREKSHFWRTLWTILATLLGAFLAFYFVADRAVDRMTDPAYSMRKMEKMMRHQERNFRKFEDRAMDNPFEPRMAPMLVNLVKEPGEYKVIVDLKPLGGSEKNVNVNLQENVVTVNGEVDKKELNREKIMNFSQAFYLDEHLKSDKIKKEVKGNKYIITIPYED